MTTVFKWFPLIEDAYVNLGKQRLSIDSICQAILDRKGGLPFEIEPERLREKISQVCSSEVQKKNAKLARVKSSKTGKFQRGVYRLKAAAKPAVNAPEMVQVSTQFTGSAGEFAVMSELLFRGYNASKMTVDDGIDIVASKENKYFHIQVKTANVKEDETFRASIKRKTFQHSSDTFYVVVLRSRSEARFENDYVILPSNKIHELVKRGVLKDSETIGLRVSKSNGRFLVSREEDVSHLVNSFDIIR